MDPAWAWVALFVFLGFTTQAMSGFGAMLISLSLSALVLPVEQLVPILGTLSLIQAFMISGRHHEHISWRLLLIQILPLMGLGAGIGVGLVHLEVLEGPALKIGLGALVLLFAASELWKLRHRATAPSEPEDQDEGDPQDEANTSGAKPLPLWASIPCLLGAGITQGIYLTGGPLLVYTVSKLNLGKAVFRATVTTTFLILNIGIVGSFAVKGQLGPDQLKAIGLFLPILIVSFFAGEWLHEKVDEHKFKVTVFSLLLLAGGALLMT